MNCIAIASIYLFLGIILIEIILHWNDVCRRDIHTIGLWCVRMARSIVRSAKFPKGALKAVSTVRLYDAEAALLRAERGEVFDEAEAETQSRPARDPHETEKLKQRMLNIAEKG